MLPGIWDAGDWDESLWDNPITGEVSATQAGDSSAIAGVLEVAGAVDATQAGDGMVAAAYLADGKIGGDDAPVIRKEQQTIRPSLRDFVEEITKPQRGEPENEAAEERPAVPVVEGVRRMPPVQLPDVTPLLTQVQMHLAAAQNAAAIAEYERMNDDEDEFLLLL